MVTMNKPAAGSTGWTAAYTANWTAIETSLVDKSVVQARGDLIAASAPSTPARLPVGQDEAALMADGTQPTGLKWAAVGSAALIQSYSVGASDNTAAASQTAFVEVPGMTLQVPVNAPGKVLILFNLQLYTVFGCRGVVRLMRDSTILRTIDVETGSTGNHSLSVVTLDSCGVGTYTFHAMWKQTLNGNIFEGGPRSFTVIPVPG
jgi:hypothetical protein